MTAVTESATATPANHARMLALVCLGHFVSHHYYLVLAPLFPIIRADFGVSYTELGLALSAFNLTSALLTPPAGYLVDRIGARPVLIGGLLIGAAALAGAALLPSFWGFVAMFALLGLGNTVYHPADYALLSRRIPAERLGQAYSLHTFIGMVGSATAPPILLLLTAYAGWRGAYLASAALGAATAGVLLAFGRELAFAPAPRPAAQAAAPASRPAASARLLLSAPILVNLMIFTFLALMGSGIQNFSIAALGALHGTPLTLASLGLSVFLVTSAVGVLAGGFVAMRTSRHDFATVAGLLTLTLAVLLIALFDMPAALLIAALGLAGLCHGAIMPSRDMLVRAVAPPDAFGRVFGFVTNGFNIGGIITPLIFGWLLDQGSGRSVFLAIAAFSLLAIPLVLIGGRAAAAGLRSR